MLWRYWIRVDIAKVKKSCVLEAGRYNKGLNGFRGDGLSQDFAMISMLPRQWHKSLSLPDD